MLDSNVAAASNPAAEDLLDAVPKSPTSPEGAVKTSVPTRKPRDHHTVTLGDTEIGNSDSDDDETTDTSPAGRASAIQDRKAKILRGKKAILCSSKEVNRVAKKKTSRSGVTEIVSITNDDNSKRQGPKTKTDRLVNKMVKSRVATVIAISSDDSSGSDDDDGARISGGNDQMLSTQHPATAITTHPSAVVVEEDVDQYHSEPVLEDICYDVRHFKSLSATHTLEQSMNSPFVEDTDTETLNGSEHSTQIDDMLLHDADQDAKVSTRDEGSIDQTAGLYSGTDFTW
ncbi:hypothetical protein MBLNU459_g5337t1 [Dothideomycetes sp. NU459]